MADSSKQRTSRSLTEQLIDLLPRTAHSAKICGQTGCGKTFILDLLEGPYRGAFQHIAIVCSTLRYKKAYHRRPWIWTDPEIYLVVPGERLQDYLRALFRLFKGSTTLYILDDLSATKVLTKKKDMLSELAFSVNHAEQSIWVLTQTYNAVLTDLREQKRWLAVFCMKDHDSFHECLKKNNVVPSEQRASLQQELAETKHAVLLLKTDQPASYMVLR